MVGLAASRPRAATHAATCARDEQSSFLKMFATWVCAVRSPMTRAVAISGIGSALRHQDGHLALPSGEPDIALFWSLQRRLR